MKNNIKNKLILIIFLILIIMSAGCEKKDIVEINIGYQSATAQTWGALILKNLKIFENELKKNIQRKILK